MRHGFSNHLRMLATRNNACLEAGIPHRLPRQ
jgi:hypothetical protein